MWLMRRRDGMARFVREWLRQERDWRRFRQPERTLGSYVWQEAEGISREAKLAWCRRGGHVAHNLQHDGVIIELRAGVCHGDAVRDLRRVCSHALGFDQPVEVKPMHA